ncbi:phage baseplate assembly protein [Methylobacillus pratensis]
MNDDDVTLKVGGYEFSGWTEIEIAAGIERQARDFKLEITRQWPKSTGLERLVRPGDLCELWIGSNKLLTGYIDATPISYDSEQVSVGVSGRSKTGDLVDCSAEFGAGQWRRRKVESILADLAKPYGVSVTAQVDTGAAIQDHQIQPGETVFESIGRLLSLRQLLSTDDGEGNVVLIEPGSGGKATTALRMGENILQADIGLDYKDVFTYYECKGQQAGSDEDDAQLSTTSNARISDNSLGRYRKLILTQSGQVDTQTCADRVQYEALNRQAKAQEVVYTVQGWRQADTALWLPNQLVRVVDPVIGFDDDRLIVEVVYRKGAGGTTTTLKLGPLAGYIPSPEARKKKKGKGGNDADWLKDAHLVEFPVKTG